VLPNFDRHELENKRILLAPYSLAFVEQLSLPFPDIELRDLNGPYQEQAEQSLELFYSAGVAGARATAREAHAHYEIVELAPSGWAAYFTPQALFRIVSLDGQQNYQVPEPAALAALGASADYVLVVGHFRFKASTDWTDTLDGHRIGVDMLRCKLRFLVWDYAHARAVVEGTVNGEKHPTEGITRELWESMGGQVTREIFSNPPFLTE